MTNMWMLVLIAVADVIFGDVSEAQQVQQASPSSTVRDVTSAALAITSADLIPINIWFVSDDGSDDNDCHSESAACRNLQAVLDRATDGADIYVTSNTLTLRTPGDGADIYSTSVAHMPNGLWIDLKNVCKIESGLSYTISHLDGASFTVACEKDLIYWTVSESELRPATVTINHGNFTDSLMFILHGMIHFIHCSFHVTLMEIHVVGKWNEEVPASDTVRSIESVLFSRSIKVYKSKLWVDTYLWIKIFYISCKIEFSYSDIKSSRFQVETKKGNENAFPFISLQIDQSSMSDLMWNIEIFPTFFIFINVSNVNMFNVQLRNNVNENFQDSNLFVHVENSTWVNYESGFMDLFKVLDVTIVSSQLIGSCHTCTLITVHGQRFIVDFNVRAYLESIIDSSHHPSISTLSLTETMFKAVESLQNKIRSKHIAIILKNNTFVIEGSVSFFVDFDFEAHNVLIKCSIGKMVQRTLGKRHVIYACDTLCEKESQYSLLAGRMVISENLTINHRNQEIKQQFYQQENHIIPSCHTCPLGATCESGIQALPNYWGYITSKPSVSMIRCPDGYCCQGNATCSGINSCNTGRTGTLCGNCAKELTESIFNPKCILTEKCKPGLVITLFILAALVYAAILLSFGTIKKTLISLLKKVKAKYNKKQVSRKDANADESGFKYMQILFYYVQDSKLFTVHLPQMDLKTENFFLKFFEFSPEIFAVYLAAIELCFAISSTIIKVAFQLSFGFLVIFFLYLVYVIQKCLSHCINMQVFWNQLKVKLVQAYLLTILFSYQKMVMGTFILVHCVDIKDLTVLFIQAKFECYTWWQICILLYICISVVPIIFVLAHLPFYVKDKKMSVKGFILACLFPLPAVIGYHVLTVWYKRNSARPFSDRSKHETIELSEILFEESRLVTHNKDSDGDKEAISKDTLETKVEHEGDIPECSVEQGSILSSTEKGDINSKKRVEGKTKDIGFCEEVIINCLLNHYKCLSFLGLRITWLGVHKIYRVTLVVCRTFIIEPVKRLYVMNALVLVMAVATAIVKPYKDQRANSTASISYIANLCIAALHLVKANYVTFGCDTNCQFRDTVVQYMDMVGDTLLLYVPLAVGGLWVVSTALKKLLGKKRK